MSVGWRVARGGVYERGNTCNTCKSVSNQSMPLRVLCVLYDFHCLALFERLYQYTLRLSFVTDASCICSTWRLSADTWRSVELDERNGLIM